MENKRKHRIRMVVMVLVMVLLSTVLASAAELKGTVIAKQGIVRKTGDFDGEEVNTLSIGTKVTVLEVADQWYRIKGQEGTVEGWMYKDIVSIEGAEDKVKKGEVTASILNVRANPATDAAIMTKLNQGTAVSVVGQQDDWYEIVVNGTLTGWVSGEFVKLTPNLPKAQVIEAKASLLKEKAGAETLRELVQGDIIYIEAYEAGWFKVLTEDQATGWIDSKTAEIVINNSNLVNRSSRSGVFANVENITRKYLGKKYAWGQTGPDRFDCSGFTYYILNHYYGDYLKLKGINLPRSSRDQATVGTTVSKNALEIGDLVFFNTNSQRGSTITHVGIYIGSGNFIHASSARGNVMISSLSEGYYQTRYIKAVRL